MTAVRLVRFLMFTLLCCFLLNGLYFTVAITKIIVNHSNRVYYKQGIILSISHVLTQKLCQHSTTGVLILYI